MQGILKVRLSDGDVQRTGCPFVGCSCRLPFADAQQLLSKSQRERFEQLLAQNYADTNPAIKWCASVLFSKHFSLHASCPCTYIAICLIILFESSRSGNE